MAHLSGFGLENFRVFKEYTWFDFAPITILVGPNNSGKSSLIKALLLLKDNYERRAFPGEYYNFRPTNRPKLRFDGGQHNLSSGNSVSNDKAASISFYLPNESIIFQSKNNINRFSFEIANYQSICSTYNELIVNENEILFSLTEKSIYLDLPLVLKNLKNSIDIRDDYDRLAGPERYANRDFDEALNFFKNIVWTTNKIIYNSSYEEVNDNGEVVEASISIRSHNQKSNANIIGRGPFDISTFWQAGYLLLRKNGIINDDNFSKVRTAFSILLELMKVTWRNHNFSFLGSLSYLPSVKGETKRSYSPTDDHVINNLIKEYQNLDRFNGKEWLTQFLSRWEKEFNLPEITISRMDEFNQNYIKIGERTLTDVGFGLSQITAILLRFGVSMFTRTQGIFLLEEPEANLHPKFQGLLADLIIDTYKAEGYLRPARRDKPQFIIETHSEYLIRKLQYLTSKGNIRPEDIVIYYFNDPNNIPVGEKQVKKINILEDGSLSDDFGSGFYDEAANWELELLKLKKIKSHQN